MWLEEVCDLRGLDAAQRMEAATVHVIADDGDVDWHGILDQTRHTLPEQCGVTHPTIHMDRMST